MEWHNEIVKILPPLTDNPNAPNKNGETPIIWAANLGPFDAQSQYGETPIYWATIMGYSEIVKILVPLTDNPNAPDNYGETPIYVATINGHTQIVKILAALTDKPTTSNGHSKIVKILASLTFICILIKLLPFQKQ